MFHKEFLKTGVIAAVTSMMAIAGTVPRAAFAQVASPAYPQQPTYPQQQPAYPQQPTYPQQQPAYPQQPVYQQPQMDPTQMGQAGMPAQSHPIRQLFAGTIATLLTASGTSLAAGLTQGVAGAISGWFARKNNQAQNMQPYGGVQTYAQTYPQTTSPYPTSPQTYPSTAATYPSTTPGSTTTTDPYATGTQPQSTYPTTGAYPTSPTSPPATYPSTVPGAAGTPAGGVYANTDASSPYATQGYTQNTGMQVYDAYTGQVSSATGTPYQASPSGYDGTLYAGIAYEVHAIDANGATTQVNPATYVFHTGDRFMVYYRPSMPGRMEVYNINPAGQQSRIDSVTMAAGELASLGPYQFSNMTGDESLRLMLAPCSTPQLLVATRDIVNVGAATATSSGVQLGACGAPTARGLKVNTRDITKVAVDGGTAFALDPVSRQELSSGQVTSREINIVFHHR